MDKKKAARALARSSASSVTTSLKIGEVRSALPRIHRHKIGGRAKAMVVTSFARARRSLHAGVRPYLADKGYSDIKTLVAF